MIKKIDKRLRLNLIHSGSIDNKITIVYVPGLADIKDHSQQAVNMGNRLRKKGIDLNFVTFLYQSHQKKIISGFEKDSEDLEQVVELLGKEGINKKDIGFFGFCYGCYVISQYLWKKSQAACLILAEPYLGRSSINKPARILMDGAKKIRGNLPIIPIKRTEEGIRYLDLKSLLRHAYRDSNNLKIGCPTLVIKGGIHSFFNPEEGYLSNLSLSQSYSILTKKFSKNLWRKVQGYMTQFLEKYNLSHDLKVV